MGGIYVSDARGIEKTHPDEGKEILEKISYVYRVRGKDLMVIAGFFE